MGSGSLMLCLPQPKEETENKRKEVSWEPDLTVCHAFWVDFFCAGGAMWASFYSATRGNLFSQHSSLNRLVLFFVVLPKVCF